MNELGEITDKIVQLLQYDPVSPLIFSSGLFLFLFGGFTFFYQFMRREVMLRIVYVTLFSLYFYYKTSGFFFLLLIAVSVSDFLIGKGIARSDRQGLRKGLLALSVALDIGLLIYFKYTNFFIGIVNGLSGHHWLDFQNIFLPVGISFFVFQSISYTADIYRRRIEPLGMWIDYIFFLSFFPLAAALQSHGAWCIILYGINSFFIYFSKQSLSKKQILRNARPYGYSATCCPDGK